MADANLTILSAGAPQTGVLACAEAFCAETGGTFDARFATAPVLRAEVESGGVTDDVINAPVPVQADFEKADRIVAGSIVPIGSIHAAVVVPSAAPDPDISTRDALIASLRAADRVVYNTASSGQYIVDMIERLGLSAAIEAKTVRVPSASAVMETLAGMAAENAIGFGQTTAIRRLEHLGVRLVGPLPGDLDKVTTYAAALNAQAASPALGKQFLDFLEGEAAAVLLAQTGME